MIREVIIEQPNFYGEPYFEPDEKLQQLLKECGYDSIMNIKARTDERIINFIKDNGITSPNKERIIYKGEEDEWGFFSCITIEKVDTSKPWIIVEDEGVESIEYLDVVDKELNYYELRGV